MKFIKKYKWIILIIILVLLFIAFIISLDFIFYNNKSVYGSRLEGIKDVTIREDLKNDVINSLDQTEGINDINIDIRGKIINILIKIDDNINFDDAKKNMTEILKKFSEKQLAFYDMQFFISKVKDDEDAISKIGYKSRYSDEIIWDGNQ